MAITYPRELPLPCSIWSATLDLADNVTGSPSGGGKMNLTQVDDPLWRAVIRWGTLGPSGRGICSAWKNSLRGGLRSFIASDTRRRTPLAYPDATVPADISGAWGGTAVVTSLGLSGVLGLSGLPGSYKFSAGDRIGLEQSGRRGYYEVIEAVTANGSGVASVTVAPFLHTTIFTTAATARVWQPKAEFTIDWSAWREDEADDPRYASVSFEAWQKL